MTTPEPTAPDPEPPSGYRPVSSIEAMAIGWLLGQLHSSTPILDDDDAHFERPLNGIFWPFLRHRFLITISEMPDPESPDHPEAREAVDAALGRKKAPA